jgi:hypothetical protein
MGKGLRFRLCTPSSVSLSLIVVVISMTFMRETRAQFNQDPGHGSYLFVEDVRFSCPKDFACRRKRSDGVAVYIPHPKYDLELVVGVASKDVREPTEQMALSAASHVFPKERNQYLWKQLPEGDEIATGKRASKFETGRGALQGFNGEQRVVFQYRRIKVKGKEVIVGYLLGLGRVAEAKDLFSQNLGGDSMPGWYAQAHIIASLTGEKYAEINSGTSIEAIDITAPKKN